jgi:hypothetical protein
MNQSAVMNDPMLTKQLINKLRSSINCAHIYRICTWLRPLHFLSGESTISARQSHWSIRAIEGGTHLGNNSAKAALHLSAAYAQPDRRHIWRKYESGAEPFVRILSL